MPLLSSFFSSQPKKVPFDTVNPKSVQDATITGNTSEIAPTIAQTEALNLGGANITDKLLAQASGGVYAKLRDKALANVSNLLNGGDITDTLHGTAAANLWRGVAGSGFGRTTALQNSVNAVQTNQAAGFNSLERWLAGVSQTYQPVSVGSMFARNTFGVEQAYQNAIEERNAKFQHDYVDAQWDWYNSPVQRFQRFEDTIVQLAGTIGKAAGA